ncbi:hypothetical protein KDA00_05820 [Candidatus Saccharibacteria bacterium]|nr:hypothetical protein [Candidatus Saccharibacteria bacterium]
MYNLTGLLTDWLVFVAFALSLFNGKTRSYLYLSSAFLGAHLIADFLGYWTWYNPFQWALLLVVFGAGQLLICYHFKKWTLFYVLAFYLIGITSNLLSSLVHQDPINIRNFLYHGYFGFKYAGLPEWGNIPTLSHIVIWVVICVSNLIDFYNPHSSYYARLVENIKGIKKDLAKK